MTEAVRRMERAITMTGRVVNGVSDEQWTLPTPCAEWDARALLNHTVGGMRIFAAQLDGREPEADHESDWLADDPKAAYASAAELDRATWNRPGALDTTLRLSFGAVPGPLAAQIHLTEVCVHGVDLAIATDRRALLDEELCEGLLRTVRQMDGFDAFRVPGIFAEETPAPPGAPAHTRLLAFLGRTVS